MQESSIENRLKTEVERLGYECIKFIPEHMNGMPDRVVLLPGGRVIWVELKTDGGVLSELQKYRHFFLRSIGHEVEVIWNTAGVKQLIDRIKK